MKKALIIYILSLLLIIPLSLFSGCVCQEQTVSVTADFSAEPLSGHAPLEVQFTDGSTTGFIGSWEWDFEDDGTWDSNQQNPVYTYSTPGTYTVKLRATSLDNKSFDMNIKTDYITVYDSNKVITPELSPDGGSYNESEYDSISVTMSTVTADAAIYYTTDGTTPTSGSTLYSGAIILNSTTELKAIAVKSGMEDSDVASATYTFIEKVATPTFSSPGGDYEDSVDVTISTATSGALIYYTTDSSTPTSGSTLYEGTVTFNAGLELKAIAVKSGMEDSDVFSATYNITPSVIVAAPVFTPDGGSYSVSVSVAMSTSTDGASIYYETDGSTPTSSSTPYTVPIDITSTTTLKAIAIKSSISHSWESTVTSAKYTISDVGLLITPSSQTIDPSGDSQLFTASGGTAPYAFELIGTVPDTVTLLASIVDGTVMLNVADCAVVGTSSATAVGTSVTSVVPGSYSTDDNPTVLEIVAGVTTGDAGASTENRCGGVGLTVRVTDNVGAQVEATVTFTAGSGWVKAYGPAGINSVQCIQETVDDNGDPDGYILVGSTTYDTAGSSDLWVIRTDEKGTILWQKTYGTSAIDRGFWVRQTFDGDGDPSGFVVAGGSIHSSTQQVGIWVFKLDSDGSVDWEKVYKGSDMSYIGSIQQTPDAGYIVAGAKDSEAIVLKLDASGGIDWDRTWGVDGSSYDEARDVYRTADGGYIVAGTTSFSAGNLDDFLIVKLNVGEGIEWIRTYGDSGIYERAYSVRQTSDEGYIVAGERETPGSGEDPSDKDVWVIKLDSSGDVLWQKTYGGDNQDYARCIQQANDGGYIVCGTTASYGDEDGDLWLIKLNSSGSIEWQKTYGGVDQDNGRYIQQTDDGGYIVAGVTLSFGSGNGDAWVLKLKSDGSIV